MGFEVKDLAGLAEPTCKFIEAIRSATGVFFEPWRIREVAKAEADAAIVKAEAQLVVQGLEQRALERLKATELRRQSNIEAVIDTATQQIEDEARATTREREEGRAKGIVYMDAPGGQKLDDDWMAQFMGCCQDVADEEMQKIWAKVLAGEFTRPGRYSVRTLAAIKLLSKQDAKLFTVFCSYTWSEGSERFYFATKQTDKFLDDRGVSLTKRMHLDDLGLINGNQITIGLEQKQGTLDYHGTPYVFSFIGESFRLPAVRLTEVGAQLATLCSPKPSPGYIKILSKSLEAERICIVKPR